MNTNSRKMQPHRSLNKLRQFYIFSKNHLNFCFGLFISYTEYGSSQS